MSDTTGSVYVLCFCVQAVVSWQGRFSCLAKLHMSLALNSAADHVALSFVRLCSRLRKVSLFAKRLLGLSLFGDYDTVSFVAVH